MDSTDGLSRGYEVVQETNPNASWSRCLRTFFNVIGDAIDGLGNLPKQEKTECQFTVKHQNRRYQLHQVLFTGIKVMI
jgi:F-type H+-transporting ATPase subunit beta